MDDKQLQALLSRLKDKDTTALEELYDRLSVPIFTIALRITKNRTLAEDVVQEVFIKLYQSPPDERLAKPRAYIFKMAHNKALDMLKSNPAAEDIAEHTEIPAKESGRSTDICEALNTLSTTERSIVTLHINGGLKFREIAELTSTPLGTVLWRYRKAISALRAYLSD